MWTINLPIRVVVNKTTTFSLNLNQYRNTHHYLLNAAKVNYSKLVNKLIDHLPHIPQCKLKYTLFVPSNRRVDISNICSIVDKFFCDALVEQGKLKDDSYDFLKEVTYCFGGIDKANPRVEVLIEPAESPEEDMQITLNQAEIELAITNYVKSQINVRDEMEIKIDIKATRGADGMTAMIDIVPPGEVVTPAPTASKGILRNVPHKAAPVEQPADDQEDPATTAEDPAEEAQEAAAPVPAPAAAKGSIFAGLNKPVNKAAE